MTSHLYYDNNLGVLRDNSARVRVGLVYFELPFNFNVPRIVVFKGPKGGEDPLVA